MSVLAPRSEGRSLAFLPTRASGRSRNRTYARPVSGSGKTFFRTYGKSTVRVILRPTCSSWPWRRASGNPASERREKALGVALYGPSLSFPSKKPPLFDRLVDFEAVRADPAERTLDPLPLQRIDEPIGECLLDDLERLADRDREARLLPADLPAGPEELWLRRDEVSAGVGEHREKDRVAGRRDDRGNDCGEYSVLAVDLIPDHRVRDVGLYRQVPQAAIRIP